MSRYIDEHRGRFGVEPICSTLGVSASADYQRAAGERSERSREDERLLERIRELPAANYFAYGSRRMWKALLRDSERVGRSRVERLMGAHGSRARNGAASRGGRQRRIPRRCATPISSTVISRRLVRLLVRLGEEST